MALLAVVAFASVGGAVSLKGQDVTAVANAAAPRTAAPQAHLAACPFPATLRGIFEHAASDADVPPAMLYAVAKIESNLREDAISSMGARGLLQLMPATARSLDLDVDEPSSNVLAGARYLRQLLDRFGSVDLALAAYNAGPTAVAEAGGAPTGGVMRYVANVNAVWRSVAGCR